jgi:bifunctional NMN adenylyltransferase/nudix hydrolase
VKGSDDADKARWFPIDEVVNMRDKLFEDHADIINYFIGRMDK